MSSAHGPSLLEGYAVLSAVSGGLLRIPGEAVSKRSAIPELEAAKEPITPFPRTRSAACGATTRGSGVRDVFDEVRSVGTYRCEQQLDELGLAVRLGLREDHREPDAGRAVRDLKPLRRTAEIGPRAEQRS